MRAKNDLVDELIKLSKVSGSDAGDANKKTEKWAKEYADIVSRTVIALKIPPGTLVDFKTISGAPATPAEFNLKQINLSELGTSKVMEGLFVGLNPNDPKWAAGLSGAIAKYAVRCGIPMGKIIAIDIPGVGVPNPPIPVLDIAGAIPRMTSDMLALDTKGLTDPPSKASISPWSNGMAGAIGAFFLTLTIPAGSGFVAIGPPPSATPPVVGTPNVLPISLVEE